MWWTGAGGCGRRCVQGADKRTGQKGNGQSSEQGQKGRGQSGKRADGAHEVRTGGRAEEAQTGPRRRRRADGR